MSSYFLVIDNLEMKEALKKLPVVLYPMEISGTKGLVVNDTSMEDVRKLIKSIFKDSEKFKDIETTLVGNTSYEGIKRVYISSSGKRGKVETKDWDGNNQSPFKAITEEILSPIVKEPICIYVPHGSLHLGCKKGFNIFLWSSLCGGKSISVPALLYGYKVDCRDGAFPSSHRGFIIYDNDYAVAELIDNNLYIHHDICHYGTENERSIYRRILVETIKEIVTTPEERDKKLKERLHIQKNQYVELCMKRIETDLKNSKARNLDLLLRVKEHQRQLIEKIRQIHQEELLTNNFEEALKTEKEKYSLEFDKLLTLKKIINLEVSQSSIDVFTDTICCKDPRSGKLHELGKFRITIPIGCGKVAWFNLTRKLGGCESGMNAPHVFSDGHACLGSAEEVLPQLIATYQFSVIAMFAIQFLESVNVNDSAGKRISEWPVVKKKKEKNEKI